MLNDLSGNVWVGMVFWVDYTFYLDLDWNFLYRVVSFFGLMSVLIQDNLHVEKIYMLYSIIYLKNILKYHVKSLFYKNHITYFENAHIV